MKTLAIKLEDDTHAQLVVLAQLDGVTLADVLRQAVEQYVDHKRSEGDLATRAASVLEEIDREASARREAIQALFAETPPAAPAASASAKKTRGRKPNGEAGG